MELIVDECGQGHNLQNNNDMIRPLPTESFSLNNTAIIIKKKTCHQCPIYLLLKTGNCIFDSVYSC